MTVEIRIDPLLDPRVAALLQAHLDDMHRLSPAESVHALDLVALRAPEITFWSAWRGELLLGCAALKELGDGHGEVKSMRTAPAFRGQGIASALLRTLMDEATRRGLRRLSLETGTHPEFASARALYRNYGFLPCGPFGSYVADPFSTFMTRLLEPATAGAGL